MDFIRRLGEYPAGYNRNVHGPFDPARYYGKPDTPFGELKIAEIPAWIGRREKNPLSFVRLFGRAYWRWQHRYMMARKASPAGYYQLIAATCLFFYYLNNEKMIPHQRAKYH